MIQIQVYGNEVAKMSKDYNGAKIEHIRREDPENFVKGGPANV